MSGSRHCWHLPSSPPANQHQVMALTLLLTIIKDAALANFKENLEEATLQWVDNKAKSKKYTAIAEELAEFKNALNQG